MKNAKPILFNTEMVKAILDGRKVQTRRVIPYGEYLYEPMNELCIEVAKNYCDMDKENHPELKKEIIKHSRIRIDDVLYVKETFKIVQGGSFAIFKAGGNKLDISNNEFLKQVDTIKWESSIHLTKEYARIFLKVTNVRVERLQDITFEEILKEGIKRKIDLAGCSWYTTDSDKHAAYISPLTPFITFWSSTAKQGYKWKDNPYVFVYEFEVIK
jgi:hypothetical protein